MPEEMVIINGVPIPRSLLPGVSVTEGPMEATITPRPIVEEGGPTTVTPTPRARPDYLAQPAPYDVYQPDPLRDVAEADRLSQLQQTEGAALARQEGVPDYYPGEGAFVVDESEPGVIRTQSPTKTAKYIVGQDPDLDAYLSRLPRAPGAPSRAAPMPPGIAPIIGAGAAQPTVPGGASYATRTSTRTGMSVRGGGRGGGGPVGDPGMPPQGASPYDALAESALRTGDIKGEQARVLAEGQGAAAEDAQRRLGEEEELQRSVMAEMETDLAALSADVDRLAKQKIAPDLSPEQFLGGMLASVLSGIITAGKGPNEGIRVMEAAIERNMQAQMANVENERRAFYAKKGVVEDKAAAAREDLEMRAKFRLAHWEAAEQAALAQAAKYNDPLAKEEAFRQAQGFAIQKNKEAAELAKEMWDRKMEEAKLRVQQGHLALAKREQTFREDQAANAAADPRDPFAVFNPKTGQVVGRVMNGRPEDAAKLQDEISAGVTFADEVGDLMRDAKDAQKYRGPGADYVRSKANRRFEASYNKAILKYAKQVSGAAYTDAQLKFIKEVLPSAESILKSSGEEAWAKFSDDLGRELNQRAMGRGVTYDFAKDIRATRPDTTTEREEGNSRDLDAGPPIDTGAPPRGTADFANQETTRSMRAALNEMTGGTGTRSKSGFRLSDDQLLQLSRGYGGGLGSGAGLEGLLGIVGLRREEYDELMARAQKHRDLAGR